MPRLLSDGTTLKVIDHQGIVVHVDRPAGSTRTGTSPEGVPWTRTYLYDYGYLPGVPGEDGDDYDAYVGPSPHAECVYVVTQLKVGTGALDEQKAMLGFDSPGFAEAAFRAHVHPSMFGGIAALSVDAFKTLLDARGEGVFRVPCAAPTASVTADLGTEDVHVPSAAPPVEPQKTPAMSDTTETPAAPPAPVASVAPPAPQAATEPARVVAPMGLLPKLQTLLSDHPEAIAMIAAQKRKSLPDSQFAWPEKRKYPIDTAPRARNAMARLEQQKSVLPSGAYTKIKGRILQAYKRFGIEQAPEAATDDKPGAGGVGIVRRKGLHMRIGLLANGQHQIEVMHAGDRLCRAEGVPFDVALYAAEAAPVADPVTKAYPPVWNQVAKVGAWRGHPAGPFELTPAIFAEIVRNFRATVNRRIPVDFEHATEQPASDGEIAVNGAPAQGWITELDNRGAAGLWGLISWMEPARTYIKTGKYQFFSPAIRFGARDRATGQPIGARMTSGALTNNPFLDGLAPVAAKDPTTSGETPIAGADTMMDRPMVDVHQFMPKLRMALRLGDLAGGAECKEQLGRLRDLCGMADHPNQMVMGIPLGDYMTPLSALMAMPANATVEQLLDAVEEMIDAAIAQHVAIEHGGGVVNNSAGNGEGDKNMSDQKDIAVQLGEEKARTTQLTAENTALATEKASLGLRLKDAEAQNVTLSDRVAKAETALAERDATIVSLNDKIAKRAEQDEVERVGIAFDTYKDTRKLTDDDKSAMRITLRSDPALFDRLYPRVAPSQQHLLNNLTGDRAPTGQTAPHQQPGQRQPTSAPTSGTMSPQQTAERVQVLLKDNPTMSREEAISRAFRESGYRPAVRP